MRRPVICIDGPAASGKTTIARELALTLGFLYLDTGVLYRALTWAALERGVEPGNCDALAAMAVQIRITVEPAPPGDPRQTIVKVDGEDVSSSIRSGAVDASVSEVSAHPEVRSALAGLQREVAQGGGVILAGRDTGTVVWPEAEVKLYLVAGDEERARRRQRQAAEQGVALELGAVLAELRRRDQYDSTRAVAPLRPAKDARILDSTNLSIAEVVEEALRIIRDGAGWPPPESKSQ